MDGKRKRSRKTFIPPALIIKMGPEERYREARKGVITSIWGNFLLSIFKLLVGIFGNSIAVIADAVHSISDILTSIVVWVGLKFGKKPPDRYHPYGHGDLEPIAGLIVAISLGIVGFELLRHAVTAMMTGEYSVPGTIAIIGAVISIFVKYGMFIYVKKIAKRINSPALLADAYHKKSDYLSSIVVVAGVGGAIDRDYAETATLPDVAGPYQFFRMGYGDTRIIQEFSPLDVVYIHTLAKEVCLANRSRSSALIQGLQAIISHWFRPDKSDAGDDGSLLHAGIRPGQHSTGLGTGAAELVWANGPLVEGYTPGWICTVLRFSRCLFLSRRPGDHCFYACGLDDLPDDHYHPGQGRFSDLHTSLSAHRGFGNTNRAAICGVRDTDSGKARARRLSD